MAGRGPAPKPREARARRNKDTVPLKIIDLCNVKEVQPALPDLTVPDTDGNPVPFVWPERTRQWWDMWAESPLSKDFTGADWDYLIDTALIHAQYWLGQVQLAGELRLRVAKFGQTPEDRQRLRIQFANADESEARAQRHKGQTQSASRARLQARRNVS